MKSKYLEIREMAEGKKVPRYKLINTKDREIIGYIERIRVGQFMHWALCPETDTFFTNGCLKEISAFITKLYGKKTNEVVKDD